MRWRKKIKLLQLSITGMQVEEDSSSLIKGFVRVPLTSEFFTRTKYLKLPWHVIMFIIYHQNSLTFFYSHHLSWAEHSMNVYHVAETQLKPVWMHFGLKWKGKGHSKWKGKICHDLPSSDFALVCTSQLLAAVELDLFWKCYLEGYHCRRCLRHGNFSVTLWRSFWNCLPWSLNSNVIVIQTFVYNKNVNWMGIMLVMVMVMLVTIHQPLLCLES